MNNSKNNRRHANYTILVLALILVAVVLTEYTTETIGSAYATLMAVIIFGLFLSANMRRVPRRDDTFNDN